MNPNTRNDNIQQRIFMIFTDQLKPFLGKQVDPEHHLIDGYQMDNMDQVTLLMKTEDEFDCEIDITEWRTLKTVQDVVDFIQAKPDALLTIRENPENHPVKTKTRDADSFAIRTSTKAGLDWNKNCGRLVSKRMTHEEFIAEIERKVRRNEPFLSPLRDFNRMKIELALLEVALLTAQLVKEHYAHNYGNTDEGVGQYAKDDVKDLPKIIRHKRKDIHSLLTFAPGVLS